MTCETCASERESRLRAERERDEARALLAWAQGCVVRAAHGLALALKGKGLDGANLFDTAAGCCAGLMDVDAAITKGEPPAALSSPAVTTGLGKEAGANASAPRPSDFLRAEKHAKDCAFLTSDPMTGDEAALCSCGAVERAHQKWLASQQPRAAPSETEGGA